jgi:IS1 family transposase
MSPEKQRQIIVMLVEGNSIRSIERMTGCHRDTILRHLLRVGRRCQEIHDEMVRDVTCQYLQCDEIWCFVAKKQRRVTLNDPTDYGDAYTFVGMDQDSKLVISFLVGKRDDGHTYEFMDDLSDRLVGHVQISTDGFGCYAGAIQDHFDGNSSYGQVVKAYQGGTTDVKHRYSPPGISQARRLGLWGAPKWKYISTSHVERQNLTMRMQMRRFTRLTNAFSKRLENLRAAAALHFAHYNFCRAHRSLDGTTPAVMAGLASCRWRIDQLLPAWGVAKVG